MEMDLDECDYWGWLNVLRSILVLLYIIEGEWY